MMNHPISLKKIHNNKLKMIAIGITKFKIIKSICHLKNHQTKKWIIRRIWAINHKKNEIWIVFSKKKMLIKFRHQMIQIKLKIYILISLKLAN